MKKKKDAIDVVLAKLGGAFSEGGTHAEYCEYCGGPCSLNPPLPLPLPRLETCSGGVILEAKTRAGIHRKLVSIAKAILKSDGYTFS